MRLLVPTLALATLGAGGVAGCGGGEAGGPATVEIAVSPTPAAVGPAQVRVTLADSAGEPVPEATVVLTGRSGTGGGDASGPGAVVDTAARFRPGLWVADSFPFDRAGDWTIEAAAELPDGRTVRRTRSVLVVGGVGGG